MNSRQKKMEENKDVTITLPADKWEDVLDFIGYVTFDDISSDELHAYGILLIESIKEQLD